MKGIRILGDYILEILVITILVAVSVASVIFFIPMMVGLTGYFKNKKDVRLFRDIFITIKENWKILIPYSLFQLAIIVAPTLNIYFLNTHPESMNYFFLGISYAALVFGSIYFVTAPTIIVNMNVNFFQLLRNGFMLLFGSFFRTLLALAIVAGVIAAILLYPYVVIATLYLAPLLITKLMIENFYVLKARVLGINVYQLKQKELSDNYLDENGNINHSEGEGGNK